MIISLTVLGFFLTLGVNRPQRPRLTKKEIIEEYMKTIPTEYL